MPKAADGRIILAMENCDTSLGDVLEIRLDKSEGPLPVTNIKKV